MVSFELCSWLVGPVVAFVGFVQNAKDKGYKMLTPPPPGKREGVDKRPKKLLHVRS